MYISFVFYYICSAQTDASFEWTKKVCLTLHMNKTDRIRGQCLFMGSKTQMRFGFVNIRVLCQGCTI